MLLRRVLLSLFLIVLLIGGGLGLAGWFYETKPAAERSATPPPPPMVMVQALRSEDILEHFTGYGTARADRRVVLSAEVDGVITEVGAHVEDGALVSEGEVLVRIDDRRYRQRVLRAEASAVEAEAQIDQLGVEASNVEKLVGIAGRELEVNRAEMRRLGELFEKEMANKREYDFARLAYERSRRSYQELRNRLALIDPRRKALEATRSTRLADAALARLDVERCTIVAPFSGQVERLAVEVGDHVLPGGDIVRLMATDRIEVPIELPASVRSLVSVGARCLLELDSLAGVRWVGSVARIAPFADSASRTFAVYVDVDNSVQEIPLVPGYFLTARVEGPVWREALALPRGAVVDGRVYVVNDERAHARRVEVRRFVDGRALVTGEVDPGDRVILTNLDVLFDGASVRVSRGAIEQSPVVVGGVP